MQARACAQFPTPLPEVLGRSYPRAAPAEDSDSGGGTPGSSRRRKRILIIEDNTDAGRIMTMMATRLGHDVRYAVNGPIGLSYARAFKPDLVLLDVRMPGMDGHEVCRRLKSDPDLRHIPVVIVSAGGSAQDRLNSEQAGAALHLVKPVEPSVMEQILNAPDPSAFGNDN